MTLSNYLKNKEEYLISYETSPLKVSVISSEDG